MDGITTSILAGGYMRMPQPDSREKDKKKPPEDEDARKVNRRSKNML